MAQQYPPPGGPPGGYPPQQGHSHNPSFGQHPPQGYTQTPPPQGYPHTPPPQQGYPPQGTPPQGYGHPGYAAASSGGYAGPPQPHGYPPQGQYPPPQQAQYPPSQDYAQHQRHFSQGQYPPQQAYPSQQAYPPQQYPPQAYPPQQGGYPPQPPPQGYQQPYGAPPGQYAAPPVFHGGQIAAPALASPGYLPVQITDEDRARYERNQVQAIFDAIRGIGTNTKLLIATISKLDPIEMAKVKEIYDTKYGKDPRYNKSLVKDLEDESAVKGDFGKTINAIVEGPLVLDVNTAYFSINRAVVNKSGLDEVLLNRSNADMNLIKENYVKIHKRPLETDIRSRLTGETAMMFLTIVAARRNEDAIPVDPNEVNRIVDVLQHSMSTPMNKNSVQFFNTLLAQNDAQVHAIVTAFDARYKGTYSKTRNTPELVAFIDKQFSGHVKDALILFIRHVIDRAQSEADQLEEAMKGFGTDELLLIYLVVRAHYNRQHMQAVSQKFETTYGKSLRRKIEKETSGNFEQLLLACIE